MQTKDAFIAALQTHSLSALSGDATPSPITIKMGRSIVFRGEVGAEPLVDKLTESHMAIIDAAMSLSDSSEAQKGITTAEYTSLAGKTIAEVEDHKTDSIDAAIQAYEALHGANSFEYPEHSHKLAQDFLKEVGLEPLPAPAAVKGTINIEMGGEQLFRYSGGKVEFHLDLDVYQPRVEQVELETAAMEAFGVSSEELADVVEGTTQPTLMHNGERLTVESIVAVAMEIPVESTPEVQAEALDAFGFDSVVDVVDEVAFNEPVTESFYSEPVAVKPAWMREDTTARVDQLRQTAIPEPITVPVPATEPAAKPSQTTKRLKDGVAQAVEEVATKVPAMAIAMIELHDQLKEPARHWLQDRFQEVAASGLGEDLKAKGAAAVRDGLKALQQLPQQTRERALADSVMTLAKEFSVVQGDGNKVEAVYQAEDFTIRLKPQDNKGLRLQDANKMNTYVVEDRDGKALLEFQHKGVCGVEITANKMPLNQQYDVIRAGGQVVADKTVAAAKTAGDRLQQMAQGLANLAPEGTKQKLRAWQHQQVAAIAQTLTNSPGAVESPAGKTFRGARYQFFESLGVTRIFGKDGQGEVFRKDQSGMQSRLTDKDLTDITSSGKVLANTRSATKAKTGKAAVGR